MIFSRTAVRCCWESPTIKFSQRRGAAGKRPAAASGTTTQTALSIGMMTWVSGHILDDWDSE